MSETLKPGKPETRLQFLTDWFLIGQLLDLSSEPAIAYKSNSLVFSSSFVFEKPECADSAELEIPNFIIISPWSETNPQTR